MMTAELVAQHGGVRPAARVLGVDPKTIRDRLRKEQGIALPPPFEADAPIEMILKQCSERFEELHRTERAETWFPIRIKDPLPIGCLMFGDPHIDDNGCNVPLLLRHAQICRETEGLYGLNIGDTTNNWAGRLARLYADQDTSRRTSHRLAKWFLLDSGVSWLCWLMGNHDAWGDGATLLREMNTQGVIMQDWAARFRLVWPDGKEVKIHAAHNFKGHSEWNIGHGPLKAAKVSSDADLLVCGHLHDWCIQQFEIPGRHRVPTLIRVRGYKYIDHYAKVNGYDSAQSGAAVLVIFNPGAADPAGRILAFSDVDAGVAVLETLRAKAAKGPKNVKPKSKSKPKAEKQSRRGGGSQHGSGRSRRKG